MRIPSNIIRYILENREKRLRDLAKRKSHADRETDKALGELLEDYRGIPWLQPIWKLRAALLITRMGRLHKRCCPTAVRHNLD